MRNLVWIVVAALIGLGGYLLFTGQSPQALVDQAADAVAPAEVEEAVDTAVSEAEDAAADAADATTEAAEAATEAADDTVDTAAAAVEDTATAAEEAVTAATEAAAGAVEDAVEAATDAVEDAVAATEEAAAGAAETGASAISELLTLEGFDLDRVIEYIEGSDLGPVQKTALSASLRGVQENPEQLQTVLDQIKNALNL